MTFDGEGSDDLRRDAISVIALVMTERGKRKGSVIRQAIASMTAIERFWFSRNVGDDLVASPSIGVTYTIRISLSASGVASVTVSDANGIIGTASGIPVGPDPVYQVLGQFEGLPYTVGPNIAVWKRAALNP